MTTPPVLLDVNLLVALTWPRHVHHRTAQTWFAALDTGWATTAVTEAGFVRISMNPRVTADPVSWPAALDMLAAIRATNGHRWWEDTVSLPTDPLVRRAPVVGYRQVSDIALAAVAARHKGRLATLDRGVLEALHPDDRDVVALVPDRA